MPDILKIFTDNYKLIFRVVYAYTKNIDDTKDVLQETFIKACNGYRSDIPQNKLLPWIIVIAKNTAKTLLRRQNTLQLVYDLPDIQCETDFLQFWVDESVSACLLTMPGDIRRLLEINLMDNIPLKKIAKKSNVPYSKLRYWQNRLFKDLERLINE